MLNRWNASGCAGDPGFTGNYVHRSLSYTSADWNKYQKYKSFNGHYKKKERKKHKLSSAAKTAAARWFLISSSAQVVLKYKSSFAKSI